MSGDRKLTIHGGTFTGSAIAVGKATVTNIGDQQVTVEDLRGALAAARPELVAAAGAAGERAGDAVDEIVEELETPQPDADVVRGGWKRVLRLLDGGAAAAESIGKITGLVSSLFGS